MDEAGRQMVPTRFDLLNQIIIEVPFNWWKVKRSTLTNAMSCDFTSDNMRDTYRHRNQDLGAPALTLQSRTFPAYLWSFTIQAQTSQISEAASIQWNMIASSSNAWSPVLYYRHRWVGQTWGGLVWLVTTTTLLEMKNVDGEPDANSSTQAELFAIASVLTFV